MIVDYLSDSDLVFSAYVLRINDLVQNLLTATKRSVGGPSDVAPAASEAPRPAGRRR